MGVYGLTSFAGAPGVTTLAVAWAYLSERPTLVVEADPVGGSAILAGAFRATREHTHSVLQLSAPVPGLSLVDQLWSQTIPFPGDSTVQRLLLPAIAHPQQSGALQHVWEPLGRAFQSISTDGDMDVVIDLGRCAPTGRTPLAGVLAHCDAIGVLAWADLPGVNTLAIGAPTFRQVLGEADTSSSQTTRLGVIAVDTEGTTYGAKEIARATTPVPVLATLPWAPVAARAYHAGDQPSTRRLTRQGYPRAVAAARSALAAHADTFATVITGAKDAS